MGLIILRLWWKCTQLADRTTWEIALLKQKKNIIKLSTVKVSFLFPLFRTQGKWVSRWALLSLRKLVKDGQNYPFYKWAIYGSFQWNLESMWSEIVIRICHYNKELYDCQLRFIREGSLYKLINMCNEGKQVIKVPCNKRSQFCSSLTRNSTYTINVLFCNVIQVQIHSDWFCSAG